MVSVIIDDHLVIDQLGNAAGVLPIDAYADVRLLQIVKAIVDDHVGPALQSVFYEVLQLRELLFGYLCHDLTEVQSPLAEVGIEIIRLVVSPFEFLVLHPVLSERDRVHLRVGGRPCKGGKRGGCDYFSYHTQVQHTLLDCRSTPNVGKYQ